MKQYFAFCKHSLSNRWYKCNDLNIDICSNPITELLNQNIDVLIYESYDGSTTSKSIQNFIEENNNENKMNNINSMNYTPNNNINCFNYDDDDDRKTIRLLEERMNK